MQELVQASRHLERVEAVCWMQAEHALQQASQRWQPVVEPAANAALEQCAEKGSLCGPSDWVAVGKKLQRRIPPLL